MILYAGMYALSMVQLFNWFPPALRGTVIALFMTGESLGYIGEFAAGDWWQYFPNVPLQVAG